ncbi:hypothetical protein [Aureimonas phyllosphaerae]|uniref:Lipoprotein-attachment site-containing protein n=1 Tax=Aureimonas phyllosphaerae TaxID=1166078 RepID=A0A7W6FVS1_9HYPH|nr:hypothetical protein [Aureimonas phyllosphaerae]MBB3936332.1 hypothetical protein [Aureimonas phyllosphaerae]MBB3959943.1 hypothetical protein [Aureimonas phyllosphaerae]SFF48090.1 hypothetical protein SAMN05216566_11678 [Aureimonas phyllosphaerae]
MHRLCLGLGFVLLLSGCGGMNRAVGVLPNTLDGLGGRTPPAAAPETPSAGSPVRPAQPGDAALAVRP